MAGLADKNVRLEARRAAPATLDAALMHALQAQAIFATEQAQDNPTVPVCAVTSAESDVTSALTVVLDRLTKLEATVQNLQTSHDSPRCYGCGKTGHFVAGCPQTRGNSSRGRGRGSWRGGRYQDGSSQNLGN